MRWIAALMLAAASPAMASDYVVIKLGADLSVSADTAWAKVGKFCAIEAWGKLPCTLASGTGDVGSVRSLAGGKVEEPMVGQTARSYTYGQTVGGNKGIDYHGTLAVEPTGRTTSHLSYILLYDQSLVPEDKREGMRTQMPVRFQTFVDNLKKMAEAK